MEQNDWTRTRKFVTDWLEYILFVLFCGGVSNTLWLFEDISTVWKIGAAVLVSLEVIAMVAVGVGIVICFAVERKNMKEQADAGQS